MEHQRRAAQVIFDVFRGGVILEIMVVHHLVNKAHIAVPIVLWPRLGHGDVEGEIGKLLFYFAEVILVEDLIGIARPVPIGHLAPRLERVEEMV